MGSYGLSPKSLYIEDVPSLQALGLRVLNPKLRFPHWAFKVITRDSMIMSYFVVFFPSILSR